MVVSQRFLEGHPFLLVDGSNLLMRLLFVRQKGSNLLAENELISSVSEGFVRHVSDTVKKNCCSGVLVAFDLGGSLRKKSLYKEYKANREMAACSSVPNDSKDYMNELYPKLRNKVVELCRLYNITVFYEFGIEADDILGLLAERLNEVGRDCIILSNDSDFLQLCAFPKVSCIIPYKKAVVDMHTFPAYFTECSKSKGVKIHACEYIFYKALVGDTSDNIVGINRVGYKTLHKKKEDYFATFPAMADLFAKDQIAFIQSAATEPNGHAFEALIKDNLDMILLNYKLIDLTSKYASATLIHESYKLLNKTALPKPSKMQLIQGHNNLFGMPPSLSNLTEAVNGLTPIYLPA